MNRLFIDDERPAPEGWQLAMTSDAAIANLEHSLVENYTIDAVSFDHDLGEDTTRPVVLWMRENNFWPDEAYVHTGNVIGEEWLVGMIRRYAPAGTLRGYGLNYWGTGPDSVIRNEEPR